MADRRGGRGRTRRALDRTAIEVDQEIRFPVKAQQIARCSAAERDDAATAGRAPGVKRARRRSGNVAAIAERERPVGGGGDGRELGRGMPLVSARSAMAYVVELTRNIRRPPRRRTRRRPSDSRTGPDDGRPLRARSPRAGAARRTTRAHRQPRPPACGEPRNVTGPRPLDAVRGQQHAVQRAVPNPRDRRRGFGAVHLHRPGDEQVVWTDSHIDVDAILDRHRHRTADWKHHGAPADGALGQWGVRHGDVRRQLRVEPATDSRQRARSSDRYRCGQPDHRRAGQEIDLSPALRRAEQVRGRHLHG